MRETPPDPEMTIALIVRSRTAMPAAPASPRERCQGFRFALVGVEVLVQFGELEKIPHPALGIEQRHDILLLDHPLEAGDQLADTGAVHVADLFQVQEDPALSLLEGVVDRLPEDQISLADRDLPIEVEYGYLANFTRAHLHQFSSIAVWSGCHRCLRQQRGCYHITCVRPVPRRHAAASSQAALWCPNPVYG